MVVSGIFALRRVSGGRSFVLLRGGYKGGE